VFESDLICYEFSTQFVIGYCGITSDQSSKSEETVDEDQGNSTQEKPDEVKQFSSELRKMDESLLNFF